MSYILKQFDKPLLRFSVIENTATPIIRIDWVNEAEKALLPCPFRRRASAAGSRSEAFPRTAPMSMRCSRSVD